MAQQSEIPVQPAATADTKDEGMLEILAASHAHSLWFSAIKSNCHCTPANEIATAPDKGGDVPILQERLREAAKQWGIVPEGDPALPARIDKTRWSSTFMRRRRPTARAYIAQAAAIAAGLAISGLMAWRLFA